MTTWQEWSGNWIVHALGWTLLHFCCQGAVIAAVLWSALQLLARRSAQARYGATCGALALMVALPLTTFQHLALAEYRLAVSHGERIAVAPAAVWASAVGEPSWLGRCAAALEPTLPWLLLAWFAGAALFLFRLSAGLGVTRKLRSIALSPPAGELQRLFEALRHQLRVARPVLLMQSALVQAPTVIGWLRPVVLIPVSCFTGMPREQIEAVLCHELAHIRRHDYLVSVVQSVVEAVLFYHPAVWWVSRQMRRERECCCDDVAVTVGGDALAYARALTALEAQRSNYPEMALGANGGILTMRIKRLLVAERSSGAGQLAAMAVLAGLMIGALAVGGAARAEAASAHPEIKPAEVAAVDTPKPETVAADARTRIVRTRKDTHPAAVAASVFEANAVASAERDAQQANETPVKISGGVVAGNIIERVAPVYPPEAKAAYVQGAVVLRAIISKEGVVENLQVISGPRELLASALDAVRQWKYKPYLLNGQPTEVETTITVNYHMASAPAAQPNGGQASQETVPRSIGGSVSAPRVMETEMPDYTEEARTKKIAGSVLLRLWVDPDGSPSHVHVVRGLGSGLDEKAVAAVERYKFQPGMEDGRPVTVAINIEVNFLVF